MKKIILNILFTVYAVIAVFTTVCLLSYNEYKISEFGDNSIILVTNDELSPDFNKGDLVIVKAGNKSKIAQQEALLSDLSHVAPQCFAWLRLFVKGEELIVRVGLSLNPIRFKFGQPFE